MRHVPRFALGTIQPGSSRDPGVWGLVAALSETGDSPLLFRASFDLSCPDGSRPIIGRASRHLDSWAMSRSDAISALARAATDHDTAIIEGAFDSATRLPLPPGEGADRRSAGEGLHTPSRDGFRSSLDRLCQWLDLPRIAIVDVRHLANCAC